MRKRIFDLIVALATLVVALPIIAIAIVLIRATSRGPAIFRQKRIGRNRTTFTIYKLRTMVHNSRDRRTWYSRVICGSQHSVGTSGGCISTNCRSS